MMPTKTQGLKNSEKSIVLMMKSDCLLQRRFFEKKISNGAAGPHVGKEKISKNVEVILQHYFSMFRALCIEENVKRRGGRIFY